MDTQLLTRTIAKIDEEMEATHGSFIPNEFRQCFLDFISPCFDSDDDYFIELLMAHAMLVGYVCGAVYTHEHGLPDWLVRFV